MKLPGKVGEAILASVGVLSMCYYSLDVLPAPFNAFFFGGGAGILTATALGFKARSNSVPLGEVGVLPGLPEDPVHLQPESAKAVEKRKLLKRYDRAYAQMISQEAGMPKADVMDAMRAIVVDLSPDIKAWTGETRIRMYMLMEEIAWSLENPSTVKASLDLLLLVLSRGGKDALDMARPLLREKIVNMYKDKRYENERFIPRLLLMLDDYDAKSVESMTKEAIHVWPDSRFSAAMDYLGLDELAQRGIKKNIKGMLGSEIANAGVECDGTALRRAVELYHAVG